MGAAASAELGASGPSSGEIEAVLQRKEMASMAGVVQLSPSELLFDACWRGNPGQVRRELTNGAHVDWCHPNLGNRTPLHAAAFAGHVECCEILISAGASVMAKDEDGKCIINSADFSKLRDYIGNHGGLLNWIRSNVTRPMVGLREDVLGKGAKVDLKVGI